MFLLSVEPELKCGHRPNHLLPRRLTVVVDIHLDKTTGKRASNRHEQWVGEMHVAGGGFDTTFFFAKAVTSMLDELSGASS